MLWSVLWHGHPDQGPPSPFPHHLFPSPIPLSHPSSSSPCPHHLPPSPITLPPSLPSPLLAPVLPQGLSGSRHTSWPGPRVTPWSWPRADGRVGPGPAFPLGLRADCGRQVSGQRSVPGCTQLSSLASRATPLEGSLRQPAGQPADAYYTFAMKTQVQEPRLEARGLGRPQPHLEGPGS